MVPLTSELKRTAGVFAETAWAVIMSATKDEALRAKEIAENRLQTGDFAVALKFAMKARRLFPDTQNITQIITICEVHYASQNKLSTSDMNWYGILLTDKFSKEAMIKRQYRKLAPLLHPDKNKSAGAEAAFKLIVEANRILSDPTKRSLYHMKISRLAGIKAPQAPSYHHNLHTSSTQVPLATWNSTCKIA